MNSPFRDIKWMSYSEAGDSFTTSGAFPELSVPKDEPQAEGPVSVSVAALQSFRAVREKQVADARAKAEKRQKQADDANRRADAAERDIDLIDADIARLS